MFQIRSNFAVDHRRRVDLWDRVRPGQSTFERGVDFRNRGRLTQVGRIQREAELRVSIANAKVNHVLQKSFALQKSTALQMSSLESGGGAAQPALGGGGVLSDASEKSTSSAKSTSSPRGRSPQRKTKSGSKSSLLERQKEASKVDVQKMTGSTNKGGREATLQALLLQVGGARI